jgi:hypothetical protein
MTVFRIGTIYFTTSLCLLLYSPSGVAKSKSAQLSITATVTPKADSQITQDQTALDVKSNDLKKGYVKINNGTTVSTTTNDLNGYVITVQCQTVAFLTSISVISNGNTFQLVPGGSTQIHLPYPGPKADTQKLSYQFQLSTTATATQYPWPLVIHVTPFL